jgi:hypothetical protein
MIEVISGLVIGLCLGVYAGIRYRDLTDKIKQLQEQAPPEPEIGATNASYAPVNPMAVTNQAGDIGLVEPKSAALLEWEEQERLKQMQYEVPRNGNDNQR